MTTPNIDLPELAAAQAQPHLTVNAALRRLDALIQASIVAIQNTPPVSPVDGDRYIVGASPTGDWTGHTDDVAAYVGTSWQFFTPQVGWLVFLRTAGALYMYGLNSPAAWEELQTGSGTEAYLAAGDLIAGTGAGTADRIPVGLNGHVLSADSGEPTGLAWIDPSQNPLVATTYRVLGIAVDDSDYDSVPPVAGDRVVLSTEATLTGAFTGATGARIRQFDGVDWDTEIIPRGGDHFYTQFSNTEYLWLNETSYQSLGEYASESFTAPFVPRHIKGFFSGVPAGGQLLWAHYVEAFFYFYVGDMYAQARVGATDSPEAEIIVKISGTVVGRISVDSSGYGFGTDESPSLPNLAYPGEVIEFYNQDIADSTLADIAISGFDTPAP